MGAEDQYRCKCGQLCDDSAVTDIPTVAEHVMAHHVHFNDYVEPVEPAEAQ